MLCVGRTRSGGSCTAIAGPQSGYCYHHDPARATERKENAAKGGKGKTSRRVATLWDQVQGVIDKVESGDLEPPQGNTMIRGYQTLIGLARLEVEHSELEIQQRRLQLDEQERLELVGELEELREMVEASEASGAGNGRGWHG